MQFTKLLVTAAAFAVASAQTVQFTNSNFAGITVGTPFNISWSGATSGITLKLKNGPATAQQLVETIASKLSKPSSLKTDIKCFAGDLSGTYYLWTPESTLVDGVYNLEIDYGSEPPNYSMQFTISGGLLSSSSALSATSTGGTSTTASTISSVTTTLTTLTSTASSASSASNSSIASKTASSTTKSSKSCYTDETIQSTNDNSGSSSTTSSTATTSVPSSNNAAQYASPFAFVLMSFVAIAALN
jgi:hypothetical protein